ncbi:unnamed protein product [Lactuca virosa]|uniref:Uncharacterized protein n=1 Tax=Lactuca virosa TaxID=75947 RepID=A0AAU9P185_9ASTR|nr:unnamed protein product [Lactuca virosa]
MAKQPWQQPSSQPPIGLPVATALTQTAIRPASRPPSISVTQRSSSGASHRYATSCRPSPSPVQTDEIAPPTKSDPLSLQMTRNKKKGGENRLPHLQSSESSPYPAANELPTNHLHRGDRWLFPATIAISFVAIGIDGCHMFLVRHWQPERKSPVSTSLLRFPSTANTARRVATMNF